MQKDEPLDPDTKKEIERDHREMDPKEYKEKYGIDPDKPYRPIPSGPTKQ